MHDHPTASHMGVRTTYDALVRQLYWPGIGAYARTYVDLCPRCRAAKHVSEARAIVTINANTEQKMGASHDEFHYWIATDETAA